MPVRCAANKVAALKLPQGLIGSLHRKSVQGLLQFCQAPLPGKSVSLASRGNTLGTGRPGRLHKDRIHVALVILERLGLDRKQPRLPYPKESM